MTSIQKSLIESLKSNACNISDAIKKNNCSLEEFYSFMKIESFRSGFDEAKQLADDFARTQFMKLIQRVTGRLSLNIKKCFASRMM